MPTVITLCGSARYRTEIHQICDELEAIGYLVLRPPLYPLGEWPGMKDDDTSALAWRGATLGHLERIRKSHVCVFANFDGYMGVSTTLELGFAAALGKVSFSVAADEEPARAALIDRVFEVKSPKGLASEIHKRLGGSRNA